MKNAHLKESKATKIAVLNKSELERRLDSTELSGFEKIIEISAKEDALGAVSAISEAVNALFTDEKINVGTDAVISSARQNASLCRAKAFVMAAISAFDSGFYSDAAASEVEKALGAIAEIDGRAVSEAVVGDIFSKFCVGK